MIVAALYPLISAVVLAQSAPVVDELRVLAADGSDTALAAQVAKWPDEAREAVRHFLIVAESVSLATEPLTSAERVATAFAEAWQDSSLLMRVSFFRSRSAADRRLFVRADSIRREGNAALYRDGVEGAMRRWRESVRLFTKACGYSPCSQTLQEWQRRSATSGRVFTSQGCWTAQKSISSVRAAWPNGWAISVLRETLP